MMPSPDLQLLERIRAEYLEMPGMRLKAEQVQRLCGVERAMCQIVLDALVKSDFLCVKSDATYARLLDGERSRPRAAKAELEANAFAAAAQGNERRGLAGANRSSLR
jgi:hypothetical protein